MSAQRDESGGLGFVPAVHIVVSSMLGAGIFLAPGVVAAETASGPVYFLVWVLGGLVALAGALSYAELGSAHPESGGDYVFQTKAYGSSVGFAGGLLLYVGVFSGSVAFLARALADHLVALGYLLSGGAVPALGSGWELPLSLLVIAGFCLLNANGLRWSARFQMAAAWLSVPTLLLLGIYLLASDTSKLIANAPKAEVTAAGLGSAFCAVYFAYAGWSAVAFIGAELDAPAKTLPRAITAGVVVVSVAYMLVAGGLLQALGITGLAEGSATGGIAVRALQRTSTASPFALSVSLSLACAVLVAGSLNGALVAGAQVGRAVGADRVVPWLADGSECAATGRRSLVVLCALAGGLVLTNTFGELLACASLSMILNGAVTVSGVIRLRQLGGVPPFRSPLYPLFPALYLGASVCVSVVVLQGSVRKGEFGMVVALGLVAATAVAHRLLSKPSRPTSHDQDQVR